MKTRDATTPRAVDVTAVERALGELWADEGGEGVRPALTRACMSNLIIFCATSSEAETVGAELGAVVEQHPARVLLLSADSGVEGEEIDAYVSAQCHLVGGGKQVCSEHVRLRATAAAALRLPSIVRPLLMADLPTSLWWAAAEAPDPATGIFEPLAEMAGQVIVDSATWTNAAKEMVAVAAWADRHPSRGIADLGWRRLQPWRRAVAESFEPALLPDAASSIRGVTVESTAAAAPVAWLLVGWLASRLRWRVEMRNASGDDEAAWSFASETGAVRVLMRRCRGTQTSPSRVTLTWQSSGGERQATFTRAAHDRLQLELEGEACGARFLPVRPRPQAVLVAAQLAETHGDPVFLDSLRTVRDMLVARQEA